MKEYSVEEIKLKLILDEKWLYRGIVAIWEKQTEDEKAIGLTVENNGVGFNGCDADILTSFAEQIMSRGSLTEKQKLLAKKKMIKYAGQLKKLSKLKEVKS